MITHKVNKSSRYIKVCVVFHLLDFNLKYGIITYSLVNYMFVQYEWYKYILFGYMINKNGLLLK